MTDSTKLMSGKSKSRTTEYIAWTNMIRRCTSPKDIGYYRYGGRGIKVYDAWMNSFDTFLADVGMKPTPLHSLDRIDNNGNYEPGNVRWATNAQQQSNRRDSSEHVGVVWDKIGLRWVASLMHRRKLYRKYFNNKEDALEYRASVEKELGL